MALARAEGNGFSAVFNNDCSPILDVLKASEIRFREIREQRIAVVKTRVNDSCSKHICSGGINKASDMCESMKVKICGSTYFRNMLRKGQL